MGLSPQNTGASGDLGNASRALPFIDVETEAQRGKGTHPGSRRRQSQSESWRLGSPASNPVFCLFLLFHVRAFVGRGKGQGEGLGGMSPLGEARSCAGQHPSLGALRPGCASATLSVALLESLHTIWATARGGGTR